MNTSPERAILAGGCFWGMQDLLRRYRGTSYRSAIFYTSQEQERCFGFKVRTVLGTRR